MTLLTSADKERTLLCSQRISRISRICAEDAVTSDGEEKITLQCGRKELEKINMSLHAQLQKKDEEIANLQAQRVKLSKLSKAG